MRKKPNLHAVGAFALAMVSVGCSFALCPPVNSSPGTLIANVKQKSGIPPHVSIGLRSIQLVDPRTSVSRVEVAIKGPNPPFKASYFLPSDNRLLMTDFDDLSEDVSEWIQGEAVNWCPGCAGMGFPGNYVEVKEIDGYFTVEYHIRPSVLNGQPVTAGQANQTPPANLDDDSVGDDVPDDL